MCSESSRRVDNARGQWQVVREAVLEESSDAEAGNDWALADMYVGQGLVAALPNRYRGLDTDVELAVRMPG